MYNSDAGQWQQQSDFGGYEQEDKYAKKKKGGGAGFWALPALALLLLAAVALLYGGLLGRGGGDGGLAAFEKEAATRSAARTVELEAATAKLQETKEQLAKLEQDVAAEKSGLETTKQRKDALEQEGELGQGVAHKVRECTEHKAQLEKQLSEKSASETSLKAQLAQLTATHGGTADGIARAQTDLTACEDSVRQIQEEISTVTSVAGGT